jgi:antitoxin ChpS
MLMTKLRTVGGSVMFAIPKAILDGLHLSPDTSVALSVSNGKLIIDPHPRPQYSLSELLALCDAEAPATVDDQAWLNDAPAGREVI